MEERDFESADTWFVRVIQHATVAGACRILARQEPKAASGLNRCADQHSRQAGMLMTTRGAAPAPAACSAARPTFPQERRQR